MPRFYLHVHNRIGSARDEEGADFPDLDTARVRAIEGIRSILSDEARQGMIDFRGRIEIAAATGDVIETVSFIEAFELHLEDGEAA
jgi:hypothetical protein